MIWLKAKTKTRNKCLGNNQIFLVTGQMSKATTMNYVLHLLMTSVRPFNLGLHFLALMLRFLVCLWTDLAKNFGDLLQDCFLRRFLGLGQRLLDVSRLVELWGFAMPFAARELLFPSSAYRVLSLYLLFSRLSTVSQIGLEYRNTKTKLRISSRCSSDFGSVARPQIRSVGDKEVGPASWPIIPALWP